MQLQALLTVSMINAL